MKDPYVVLGVPRTASDAQIRYAYRQARSRPGGDGSPEAQERVREIERAYELLSDPRKRASYDAATAVVPPPPTAPPEEEQESEPPDEEQEPDAGWPAVPIAPEAEITEAAAPHPGVVAGEAAAEEEAEHRPRNPVTRFTHRLPRPWRIALDWIITIAGAVGIVLAIKAWVVNPYRIPSSSMEPTLHCARPGSGCEARFSDRVLANRFIYHFRSPHRGEIVVFKTPKKVERQCGPGTGDSTFVKRLIGLPGERITERNGRFLVDGRPLNDTAWVKPNRRDQESGFWAVPKNSYFFVGDNRGQSCDSRRWGSVPRENLIGPVFATYWPPNRISVSTPGSVGIAILAGLAAVLAAIVGGILFWRRGVR